MVRSRRIVGHDVDFALADHVAAEVFAELDRSLQRHAQVAGLVIGPEKLVGRVDMEHVSPSAAVVWFQERREADVVEHRTPVVGELLIAEGHIIRVGRHVLMRHDRGARHGNTQLRGQSIVEELIVRRPPERIVDHVRPGQHRVLQVGAVERHVVRNAVDDDGITAGHRLLDGANLNALRLNVRQSHRVHLVDECLGKGVLLAEQNSDLLHVPCSLR